MTYQVLIRRNSDGLHRVCDMPGLEWHGSSLFWWTDGNFGCDCNRRLCFEQALAPDFDEDSDCGTTAYTVIKAILPDGRHVKIDEDAP